MQFTLFVLLGVSCLALVSLPPAASINSLVGSMDAALVSDQLLPSAVSDQLLPSAVSDQLLPSAVSTSVPPSSDTTTVSPAPSANNSPSEQSFQANDFQCIDDTQFKQFTSATAFVIGSCPPGFCFTRTPPKKNPCVGKERAQKIDGTESAKPISGSAAAAAQSTVTITQLPPTASTASSSKAAPGTQFITGPCTADADCASGCCETSQNICRAPLSLTPGVQSCKDGRSPNFDGPSAKFVNIKAA